MYAFEVLGGAKKGDSEGPSRTLIHFQRSLTRESTLKHIGFVMMGFRVYSLN